MKAVISGIGSQNGDMSFPIYPDGEYVFQIVKAAYTDKTADKFYHEIITEFTIVDGPDRPNGKTTIGGKYTDRNYIPTPDHPKFSDDWNTGAQNRLVNLTNALGIKIKNDTVPFEQFKGKTVKVKLGHKKGTDQEGNERDENVIRKFLKDDGAEGGEE